MPPSPIPAPLPPWARTLLQLAPFIQAGLQEFLQYIHALNDNTQTTNSEWRHVQMSAEPVGSTEFADRAITTFDIVNITGGTVDNSWTQADYNAVQTQLSALATNWATRMGAGYRWVETRYYRRAFNPLTLDKPFQKGGPPDYVYQLNITGSGTGPEARQVAWTTTDRTTYPKHWGRNYWPFPSGNLLTSQGLIGNASVDSWGATVENAYAALMAAEFFPVVPVTQVDKVPTRGLLTLTQVQMDNIPDVIRRRRPHLTTHKFNAP